MRREDLTEVELARPVVDLRGWDVLTSKGVKLGTIAAIMLDAEERKPRYMAVAPTGWKGHVLLPIGYGARNAPQKQVVLDRLTPELFRTLPLLSADVVTSDFERRVYTAVTGKSTQALDAGQWYSDPVFDPTNLFGKAAPAGAV